MIHPDWEIYGARFFNLDGVGRVRLGIYQEECGEEPHFHIISENGNFDAAITLSDGPAKYYHPDETDILTGTQLEQLKAYFLTKVRQFEAVYKEWHNKLHGIAKRSWDTIPHYLITENVSPDGCHYIMYPNNIANIMNGRDDEAFEEHGVIAHDIVVSPHYPEGEENGTFQCAVLMKTKDVRKAADAILEMHMELYGIGMFYAFPFWLNLLGVVEDKNQILDEEYDDDELFAVLVEEMRFYTREQMYSMDKNRKTEKPPVIFAGKL